MTAPATPTVELTTMTTTRRPAFLRLTTILMLCVTLFGGAACGDDAAPEPEGVFPEGFLWGTAVAGFQVDMGCPTISPDECEDRGSDWYQWVTDPDLIADGTTYLSGDPVSMGPGHYELYETDFDLIVSQLNIQGTGPHWQANLSKLRSSGWTSNAGLCVIE